MPQIKFSGMHLRSVVESVRSLPFLTIMVDETTDASNKEQVVICFRWVDDKLEGHEEFYIRLSQLKPQF